MSELLSASGLGYNDEAVALDKRSRCRKSKDLGFWVLIVLVLLVLSEE